MTGWWWAAGGLLVVALMAWLWTRRTREAGVAAVTPAPEQASAPRAYSPQNVGNDASARPWEQSTLGRVTAESAVVSAGPVVHTGSLAAAPADFDPGAFLQATKAQFLALQTAWDQADMSTVRSTLTAAMLGQIEQQLAQREQERSSAASTEVVMLDAQLLGVEASDSGWEANVEFSGLIREAASAGPSPFRELWSISRERGQERWLVAGVQALQ